MLYFNWKICSLYGMLFVLFLLLLNACSSKEPSKNDKPDFITIEQYSDPYKNGLIHGSQLKEIIAKQINTWEKQMLLESQLSLEKMEEIIFQKTSLVETMKKRPHLLEEIYGIADGAEINRNLVLCYNLGEEIYNYVNMPTERCSNLAVSQKDSHVLFYNQDLPPFLHGNNQVVILKHPNAIVFTMPGMLALSGVSKTLAVSCNSLSMLEMNLEGLPLSFVIRDLLQKETWEEAIELIHQTPCAIPQNLMMVSKEGMVGFEISKQSVEKCKAQNEQFLLHTNFPIHNKNYKYSEYQPVPCNRYKSIEKLIQEPYNYKNYLTTFGKEPLSNQESYLRFSVEYNQQEKLPIIYFINPQKSNSPIKLALNK